MKYSQLFHSSFVYAGTFASPMVSEAQQNPYSLPSYLDPGISSSNSHGSPANTKNGHVTALREALIENWKSDNFRRFVEACKAIVDELAMAQTTGNGRAEMLSCERVFKQATWLWGQIFPEVTGMGEKDALDEEETDRNGSADRVIEFDDDEDAQTSTDSPYVFLTTFQRVPQLNLFTDLVGEDFDLLLQRIKQAKGLISALDTEEEYFTVLMDVCAFGRQAGSYKK